MRRGGRQYVIEVYNDVSLQTWQRVGQGEQKT